MVSETNKVNLKLKQNCCKNSISSSQIKETLTPKVKQNAKFLSELCLLDEELLCYEQSKIAATCLMLAMENEKHKVKLSVSHFSTNLKQQ